MYSPWGHNNYKHSCIYRYHRDTLLNVYIGLMFRPLYFTKSLQKSKCLGQAKNCSDIVNPPPKKSTFCIHTHIVTHSYHEMLSRVVPLSGTCPRDL